MLLNNKNNMFSYNTFLQLNENHKKLVTQQNDWLSTGDDYYDYKDECYTCGYHLNGCDCETYNDIDDRINEAYFKIVDYLKEYFDCEDDDISKCEDCHYINICEMVETTDGDEKNMCRDGCILRSPCGHIHRMKKLGDYDNEHSELKINYNYMHDIKNWMLQYKCSCSDEMNKPFQIWFGSKPDNVHDCIEEEWTVINQTTDERYLICNIRVELEPLD